jgi:glycosyltransferase involved in cell wall biosynthesis
MTLRVLHFAEDSDTSGFFPQLARWHDRNRYTMFFGTLKPIAPWLRQYMEDQGVPTVSCDARGRLEYPLGALRLARFLRREGIDVLHTHLFDPSVLGLLVGLAVHVPIRVMTRHHSDYHTRIHKTWHIRLDRLCTRLSHAVIAVSHHTAEHMLSEEHAPPGKIHVIHNGIDFDRVRVSAPHSRERLRREFGSDTAHLLLVAGRLHPEKGYEVIFEALRALRDQAHRPVRLLVAGTGALDTFYRERVAMLGCADMVEFLGFRRDLPDLMTAVDLVVLPSVAEAFGLVVAEALYLGTPVVASRVGGIPEILDDGIGGILVPPADSAALADAIIALLQDDARRNQLAGSGRNKVMRRFSFEGMVRSYEAVYERLQSSCLGTAAGGAGVHRK